jgi:hypothetical protein
MSRYEEQKDAACDRWMDHVSAPDEASLPLDFKLHMTKCETCRDEWYGLRIVWEALALDTKHVEVPDGLKSEVMNAIFGADSAYDGDRLVIAEPKRSLWRRRWFLASSAACVVLLAGWCFWKFSPAVWKPSQVALPAPAQTVLKEWQLASAMPSMPAAKGSIQLLREGDQQKVVVHTEGLAPTANEQAYQVWLIIDGNRYNCGTFRVDQTGKGSLVYDLKRADVQIDGFGITLEPDALGTKPRGTKVMGTVKQS